MLKVVAFAALVSMSSLAWAGDAEQQLALAEGGFAEQRAQIEADLADGKTYAEIDAGDRSEVRASLERIGQQLDGVASIDDLTEEQKTRVFNDQEVINTILTQAAADSRLICERVTRTGSNRRTTTCLTVAERERRRTQSQDDLRDYQRSVNGQRAN